MNRRKKGLTAGLTGVILATTLTVPVFAHGHGQHNGSVQRVQTSVTVCTEADCTLPGRHFHSGWIYCGYDHENGLCDGSCAVAACPYEDCTAAGHHPHYDITYCSYDHEKGFCDGSCAAAVCPSEGCTVSGRHLHDDDNTAYCGGYNRENRPYNGSNDASLPRHHGHHHGRG